MYLGRYTYVAPLNNGHRELTVDLYIHPAPKPRMATLLARYSDEGPDYSSFDFGTLSDNHYLDDPPSMRLSTYAIGVVEACRRAMREGLL